MAAPFKFCKAWQSKFSILLVVCEVMVVWRQRCGGGSGVTVVCGAHFGLSMGCVLGF